LSIVPSTLASYVATPAVSIAGHDAAEFADLLISVIAEQSTAGLSRCEVRLEGWGMTGGRPGYVWADRATVDFGADVAVAMGPPDERGTVFSGRVTGIEGDYPGDAGPAVVVLAEDSLQDLRMTRRTRTFAEMTDAQVVERIARDHGLDPRVDLDGPEHPEVCQLNQSDLAFLRDRALTLGADLWLDGRTLHVGTSDEDPIVLRHGRELLSFRVLADLALQVTEQRVAGWDPESKAAVLESGAAGALAGDLGNDLAAAGLLADKFGDRVSTTTLATAVTSAEARAIAGGLYHERARRFVTGSGVADGVAGLAAGRTVSLEGLGAMFDGNYRLTRVAHCFDRAHGYRTQFDVERPGIGR
jgi:phage protein D